MEARLDVNKGLATIANGLIALEMECQGHLRLRHLRNLASGRDWIPQPPSYPWGVGEAYLALVNRTKMWPDLAPPSKEFELLYSPTAPVANWNSVKIEGAADTAHVGLVGLARRTVTGLNRDRPRFPLALKGRVW